jgi:hypothetical protein
MKIDISAIDRSQFMVHEHVVNGEVVYLVHPKNMGVKWTNDNIHLRSSIWDSDGNLVSASFKKFTNWGENPENFPVPESLRNACVVEKLDGSTLIVSKYKGNYILRTRGTTDAAKLDNGYELEQFKQTILPKLLDVHLVAGDTWKYSFLFEWVSPVNKIVLNYGDSPDWFLIGIIYHGDYSLIDQLTLDNLAWQHGLKRPTVYSFPTIEQLLKDVDAWKLKEGVVVYSNRDQMLHKVKGAWYLALHHMKSELASVEKVMDVWLDQNMPTYNAFYDYIATTFDFELAEQCRGTISNLCDARKEVDKIVAAMADFVESKVRCLPSRKEQAQLVLGSYGNTNRSAYVFALLDGKTLTKDQYKKLMFQVIMKK